MPLVLLAVDESEASLEAARRARDLFGADATYLAVNVAERIPEWAGTPMRWGAVYPYPFAAPYPLVEEEFDDSTVDDELEQARATASELAAQAGVVAAGIGDIGDPALAILDAQHRHDADVIVVGSSHKSWWQRLVDGSVSKEVVRTATCPVLVVPHD